MTARNALSICSSACFASFLAAALAMPAAAQTADATTSEPAPAEAQPSGVEAKAEYIHHEDDQTRIDEVRIGGQTRSIKVQPKTGAPGYEISPTHPGQFGPNDGQNDQGNAGRSRWRILTF